MNRGAGPNGVDHAVNTAAHLVIMNEKHWRFHMDAIVKLGTDLSMRIFEGQTVFHMAAALPMHTWTSDVAGGETRLKYLIETSLDLNAADYRGTTALHIAAIYNVCSVAVLSNAGADRCAKDYQKRTVLHYAARGGNANSLGFLIDSLKKTEQLKLLHAADCNSRTVLHDAVRPGVVE